MQRKLGNLQEANALLQNAMQEVEQAVAAATSQRSRRVTLLESPYLRARAMQIVIGHDLGHTNSKAMAEAENILIAQLAKSCRGLPPQECDVLYGRAGALQVIFFLRQCLGNDKIGTRVALQLADEIIREGQRYAAQYNQLGLPLLWEWHETKYLGAAHGVVGILHTLLCLRADELAVLNERYGLHEAIRQTIQALSQYYSFPSGNLDSSIKSPSHGTSRTDRLVHWCHGAPGHILLLIKAHEFFEDDHFKQQAMELAQGVVWKRGLLRKGVGLCHGISGNAYTLLAVARANNNDNQGRTMTARAHAFARFAWDNLADLEGVPDAPYSLYNGLGALCTLFLDLLQQADEDSGRLARFPLYDFV